MKRFIQAMEAALVSTALLAGGAHAQAPEKKKITIADTTSTVRRSREVHHAAYNAPQPATVSGHTAHRVGEPPS